MSFSSSTSTSLKPSDYNNLENIVSKSAFINPLNITLDYQRKCLPSLLNNKTTTSTNNNDLKRIYSLGEIGKVFEEAEGRYLVGEVITKPQIVNFGLLRFVLQIESNNNEQRQQPEFIWVHLYNVLSLSSSFSSSKHVKTVTDDQFSIKTKLKIKHPLLVKTLENELVIHVVNPFDLVFIEEVMMEEQGEEEEKIHQISDDPKEWDVLREEGNKEYKEGNIHKALRVYLQCLKVSNEGDLKAWGNLIHMNYLLKRFETSLLLCEKVLSILIKKNSEGEEETKTTLNKILYRKYLNLIALEKFEEANKLLLVHQDVFKTTKEKEMEVKKNQAYLTQQKSGVFSWADLFVFEAGGEAKFCDYVGPVAVQHSKGCGRGLFSTRKVKQGEVLFVCNALAMADLVSASPVFSNAAAVKVVDFPHRTLLIEVCKAIASDSRLYERVNVLSGGEEPEQKKQIDLHELYGATAVKKTTPQIDMDRLFAIIKTNSFNNGARSAKENHKFALFPITAFCNHSCVPNAFILYVGNTHVVKAARDLEAGEEVTIRYFQSQGRTLRERRAISKNWGFECACSLCKKEAGEWKEFEAFSSDLEKRFAMFEQQQEKGGKLEEWKQKNEKFLKEISQYILDSKYKATPDELLIKSVFLPIYLMQMHLVAQTKNPSKDDLVEETIFDIMEAVEPCSYEHVRLATISYLQKQGGESFLRWVRLCAVRYNDCSALLESDKNFFTLAGEDEALFLKSNPFFQKLLNTLRESCVSRKKRFDFCETFRM